MNSAKIVLRLISNSLLFLSALHEYQDKVIKKGIVLQTAVSLAFEDTHNFPFFEYYGEIFRWAEIIDPLVHRLAVAEAKKIYCLRSSA